jgi:hypothetical protein
MTNLAFSLEVYSEFQHDPAIRAISDLLHSFRTAFSGHYDGINQNIISRLQSFLENDIHPAEEESHKANETRATYLKMFDAFTSLSVRKFPSKQELEERTQHLSRDHWEAVNADFRFDRALSLVERKKLLELTSTFLVFINLASFAYRECTASAEDGRETLAELHSSIPETIAGVSQFESQTAILGSSLKQAHTAYLERLNAEFPGSNAREHEGWLMKRGEGISKSWQRHFFVCRDAQLSYFRGKTDPDKPLGALDLKLTTVQPISPRKTYLLKALTEWDAKEWAAIIRNNIDYLLDP